MTTVKELLAEKGQTVWSTTATATVHEALKALAKNDVGTLVVLEAGRPVGMFSERDYARKVALMGKSSLDTQVKQVMAAPIFFVRPETTSEECMALMTEKHIRHLPVMDGEKLVGLVSIGDIVKALISDQKQLIDRLQDYAMGKYL